MTGYAVLVGLLLGFALWVAAFVDCARSDADAYTHLGVTKELTMLLVFMTGCLGGVYWFTLMRRRVTRSP